MDLLIYLIFILLEKIIPLFPLNFIRRISELKGGAFYYVFPVRKNAALKNLKFTLSGSTTGEREKIIKDCYRNVLTVIAEFFWFKKLGKAELNKMISISNPELIHDKLNGGKGLILQCAHFGNWELMAFGVSFMLGIPFNVIVKQQANKRIDRRINRIRELHGNRMVEMSSSPREVLKLLRENKVVAMLSDQSAPGESVKVSFFSHEVPFFEGAARFALKTGAPVVFGVPSRNADGTYSLTLHEIKPEISCQDEDKVKSLTQNYASLLESHIRKYPGHWLWFHRRFKGLIKY